jgi:serine/threonine protein kinase
VHRDLKPGNILKVNQQYKLADFGLIRTLNNKSHTQTVHNSGTIIYMPPEAFKGDISSAWDLWSLGIMLIEMTTNQLPYNFNNDIHQLMAKVMNCDLQIPSLPKEFKPIIEGCLQKDRKQRWTAQQVLNALQSVGWASSPSSQKIQTSSPSSQQAQPTGKMPVSQIPLKTAKANFTKLDRYLGQRKWQEADEETTIIMCNIMYSKRNPSPLYPSDYEGFPREELKIIDSLWVKYSNDKFGFSVQKQIWLECGGEVDVVKNLDWDIYKKFAYKIDWRRTKVEKLDRRFLWKSWQEIEQTEVWLSYRQLNFTVNAPRGHLPAGIWGKSTNFWQCSSGAGFYLFSLLD